MLNLIFDFDGVIGNTKEAAAQATAFIEGIDAATALGHNDTYARTKPNYTRSHTLTDQQMEVINTWTSNFGDLMQRSNFLLFDAFVAEIESINTQHKAIVSSGSQKYVIPALQKTKINPTHVLSFEDHHSKEEKIEIICKDWGVTVTDVYYFTDTLADVYELRDMIAPEKLIGVSWGYCSAQELATVLPQHNILKEPHDIHNVLSGL